VADQWDVVNFLNQHGQAVLEAVADDAGIIHSAMRFLKKPIFLIIMTAEVKYTLGSPNRDNRFLLDQFK
jgi:hypothetical protein